MESIEKYYLYICTVASLSGSLPHPFQSEEVNWMRYCSLIVYAGPDSQGKEMRLTGASWSRALCVVTKLNTILPHHPHSPPPINRADKRCSRVSFVDAIEKGTEKRCKLPKTELLLENQIIFWVLLFLCVFHGLLSSASWQAVIPNVCRSARCRPFYQWARSNSP